MLNDSRDGFTSGKSLKSFCDRLFWCGWDLTNFTTTVERIDKLTDLTHSGHEDLLESLCSQEVWSFDEKHHGLVYDQINLLTCTEPRKQEIREKLAKNDDALGFDEEKTKDIGDNLKVSVMYGDYLNVVLLGDKLDRLTDMRFDTPKTNKITDNLMNIVTVCTDTLAGAKMLTASATTQEERNLTVKDMVKVTKMNTLDVIPEQELPERLYKELVHCLPDLTVRTPTEGKNVVRDRVNTGTGPCCTVTNYQTC